MHAFQQVAYSDGRQCCTPTEWALVPYGGAGGEIDGLLMKGLNVVAIERNPHMIKAIKHRVAVIQARLSNDTDFDMQEWLDSMEKPPIPSDEDEDEGED